MILAKGKKTMAINNRAFAYTYQVKEDEKIKLYIFFYKDEYVVFELPDNPNSYKIIKEIYEGLSKDEVVEIKSDNLIVKN